MESIKLGDRVQDRISGVKGIVIGYHYWLFGCERLTVQPEEAKDGKPVESFGVDAAQCEILGTAVVTGYNPPSGITDSRDLAKRPAGPRTNPERRAEPAR